MASAGIGPWHSGLRGCGGAAQFLYQRLVRKASRGSAGR